MKWPRLANGSGSVTLSDGPAHRPDSPRSVPRLPLAAADNVKSFRKAIAITVCVSQIATQVVCADSGGDIWAARRRSAQKPAAPAPVLLASAAPRPMIDTNRLLSQL